MPHRAGSVLRQCLLDTILAEFKQGTKGMIVEEW